MATKARAFTGIVYTGSPDLPDDWQDRLRDSLGMWLLSPLHTPDPVEDMETGAIKVLKPHRHVMYLHCNTIPPSTARGVFERYPWIVTPPADRYFMVGSVRNLSRYFLHLDQPEKEQFQGKPEELLTSLNNFPVDLERELTRADKRRLKVECISFVRSYNITEYNALLDALVDNQDWELFDFASDHTQMLQAYLWGVRNGSNKAPKD